MGGEATDTETKTRGVHDTCLLAERGLGPAATPDPVEQRDGTGCRPAPVEISEKAGTDW